MSIDKKVKDLEEKLLNVKGKECEVYARIVGYYRPLKNWNIGKKSEYKDRVNFEKKSFDSKLHGSISKPKTEEVDIVDKISDYALFYRTTCPNCPAVKRVMETFNIEGGSINVDTDLGFGMATKYNVMAVPTVVFFNERGKEIYRASTVTALTKILKELNKWQYQNFVDYQK